MRIAINLVGVIVALLGLSAAWANDTEGQSCGEACISTDPNFSDSSARATAAAGSCSRKRPRAATNCPRR